MALPPSLEGLGWQARRNFLGLDAAASAFESARTVILPVPYEATTSWGGGTRGGPAAILEASRYIELYDQELDADPSETGISTLPPLELPAGPAEAMTALRESYDRVLDAAGDRFTVLLGGEHSLSGPPIEAWLDRLRARGRSLSVLQVDAHTDLREEYGGTPHSHAAVMHRIHEAVESLVAVGIRALTSEEAALARERAGIHVFYADDIHGSEEWIEEAVDRLGEDVYITFDVDGFDPALVPSTGTPEPGGLEWYPVLKLLRRVFESRTVHAADIVELAPVPALHAPDFLVAKLVYKMVGYRHAGSGG